MKNLTTSVACGWRLCVGLLALASLVVPAIPSAKAVESHQSPDPTPWPLSVPFNDLVDRIMTGRASAGDKAELKKLVEILKAGGRPGPWFDQVRVATSNDGLNFTDTRKTVLNKASVPEAVVDSRGDVWLFYVDLDLDKLLRYVEEGRPMKTGFLGIGGLSAARSPDGVTFTPVEMEIGDVVQGEVVDPDIVLAADGTYHLYYLGVPARELHPSEMDPARAPGAHRFYLATSRDLVHWEQQGVAWTGPFGGADPAVYRVDDKTYYIIAGGTGRSDDGGRTFKPVSMFIGQWGQPDVIAVAGGFRAFYGTLSGVKSAFSTDGVTWKEEAGVRLSGGADPTVVRMKDGTYRMYYKIGGLQPTPTPGAQPSPPAGQDIRTHRVHFGTSQDGLTWRLGESPIRQAASVPDLLELTKDSPAGRKGTLIVTFVDASAMRGPGTEGLSRIVSTDGGKTWSDAQPLKVLGKLNRGAAVDPSLIQLPDGRVRLYFFGSEVTQGDPASDPAPHRFYSAVSSDGLTFEVEPGIRFEAPQVTDPEVVTVGSEYVMYISRGAETLKAVSSDGLTFRAVPNFLLRDGGVPGAVALPDGSVRVFVSGRGGVLSVLDRPGQAPVREEGVRVAGGGEIVADPDVVRREDGSFAGVFKRVAGSTGGSNPDFDGDGEVGFNDFFAFAAAFGQKATGESAGFDLDRSGEVDFGDFFIFADSFGKKVSPSSPAAPLPPPGGAQGPGGSIKVTAVNSQYATAPGGRSGWFTTGQSADLMLSGPGFNQTGGPLLFNHPSAVVSDGTRLVLGDRNNNRVLVWNTLPTGNTPPDLVLGQPDFNSNNPGTGPDQMNWPMGISTGGGRLAVADAYNNRILIWNTFPTRNGQLADLILNSTPALRLEWPWGVWTDGTRLAVSVTFSSRILLWNTFPKEPGQAPDLSLTAQGKMGTPRTITSNGRYLIVGDHNPRLSGDSPSVPGDVSFVWKTWPTRNDQPYDFTLDSWLQGDFTPDGRLLMVSTTNQGLMIWDRPPTESSRQPDLVVGGRSGWYSFFTGDGSSIAVTQGRVYLSLSNGNKIVGYHAMPARADQAPDFVIGAPDIHTNTLDTHFIVSNPVVASDGKSLFVSSDFDRRLYVWKRLPDQSDAYPDWVYSLPEAPWDNALWGQTLALAGKQTVYIWKGLPLNGEMPALTFSGGIGSVKFQDLQGVALDSRYLYLADGRANRIYVWEGIPTATSEPKFTLPAQMPKRIASDGESLVVIVNEQKVVVYQIADLSSGSLPSTVPTTRGNPASSFNLPGKAIPSQGHLFVADTGFNRVLIWNRIADALAGRTADVILGTASLQDISPEIGADKLFWPGSLTFDGSYLWVGEFKFSERILRFSIHKPP